MAICADATHRRRASKSTLRSARDSGRGRDRIMRTIVAIAINLGLALMLFLGMAAAQERGGMMSGRMHMMGWPMMLVMGLFWILLLILMVLAILWLIKQLRKSGSAARSDGRLPTTLAGSTGRSEERRV